MKIDWNLETTSHHMQDGIEHNFQSDLSGISVVFNRPGELEPLVGFAQVQVLYNVIITAHSLKVNPVWSKKNTKTHAELLDFLLEGGSHWFVQPWKHSDRYRVIS